MKSNKSLTLDGYFFPELCLLPSDKVSLMVGVRRDGVLFTYASPELECPCFKKLSLEMALE